MAPSDLEVLFVPSWFSSNLSVVVLTSMKIDPGYEIKRMSIYLEGKNFMGIVSSSG